MLTKHVITFKLCLLKCEQPKTVQAAHNNANYMLFSQRNCCNTIVNVVCVVTIVMCKVAAAFSEASNFICCSMAVN